MTTAVTLPFPRILTRQDCERMAGEGSLDYDRFELIEGALIPKVSKNHPYSIGLVTIMEWLQGHFRGRRVAPETAIDFKCPCTTRRESARRSEVLIRYDQTQDSHQRVNRE